MSPSRTARRELAIRYGALGLVSGAVSAFGALELSDFMGFLWAPGFVFGVFVLVPLLRRQGRRIESNLIMVMTSGAVYFFASILFLLAVEPAGLRPALAFPLAGGCGAILLALPVGHLLWEDCRLRDRLEVGVAGLVGGIPFCAMFFGAPNNFFVVGIAAGMLTWQTLVAIALARLLPDWWRTDPNRCATCDYDLKGNTTGVCPECGSANPGASPRPGSEGP